MQLEEMRRLYEAARQAVGRGELDAPYDMLQAVLSAAPAPPSSNDELKQRISRLEKAYAGMLQELNELVVSKIYRSVTRLGRWDLMKETDVLSTANWQLGGS